MTSSIEERLYALLPRIYRELDVGQGEPLRALLAVIEREFGALESDIDGLYADLFIETCAERMAPYIGDLIGVRRRKGPPHPTISRRPQIANTITYRQRKGTKAVVERAVEDVTGWKTVAVEFFDLLATTQHLRHIRPGKGELVSLREAATIERIGTPFDSTAHTADLRRPSTGDESSPRDGARFESNYNVPNMGLFLWRLETYPRERSMAREIRPGCYTFSPLGVDGPLFNRPRTESGIGEATREPNVSHRLRPLQLQTEFDAIRQAAADGVEYDSEYFGEKPVFQILVGEKAEPVDPKAIIVKDLSEWDRPSAEVEVIPSGDREPVHMPVRVAVDPVVGRLAFPEGVTPNRVLVSYTYAFSTDVGGGPYPRLDSVEMEDDHVWRAIVSQGRTDSELDSEGRYGFSTVQEAVQAWRESGGDGVIEIGDNASYDIGDTLRIDLTNGRRLLLRAGEGMCPCLIGRISVAAEGSHGTITLSGLFLDGRVQLDGDITVEIVDCTIKPPADSEINETSVEAVPGVYPGQKVSITRSIVGPLRLPRGIAGLQIRDSIVDGGAGHAISDAGEAPGPSTALERTTVFGAVLVEELVLAADTIFTLPVVALRRQTGSVRYC